MKPPSFTPEQLANVFIVRRMAHDFAKMIAKDFRERSDLYRPVPMTVPTYWRRNVKFDVRTGGSDDL